MFKQKIWKMLVIRRLLFRACYFSLRHYSASSHTPPYNYGLEGKAKGRKTTNHKVQAIRLEGEVIFGTHPVALALSAGKRTCHKLFLNDSEITKKNSPVAEIMEMCSNKNIPVQSLDKNTLMALSGQRPTQGVCLDVSTLNPREIVLDRELLKKDMYNDKSLPAVWLLPYEVKDPMNFGSLVRSAYCLGVDRVLSSRSCPLSPVVSKASAGALEVQDIQRIADYFPVPLFLELWKDCGGRVVGTTCQSTGEKAIPFTDYKVDCPTLLLSGNEGTGLPEDVLSMCDVWLHIYPPANITPRHERVNSFNVAVATAITLHSVMHSRS